MSKESRYDVIVVGGGAAGMMAAGQVASRGRSVLLLEKNKVLGKKLSITGGGRCNITNDTHDFKEFLESFPTAKKYLYSPFSQFSVQDTFNFFQKLNLETVTQARQRAFPLSEDARDVTHAMMQWCESANVTIHTSESVKNIEMQADTWQVQTNKGEYQCPSLMLSTGGYAAPETGSTGDGFKWLESLGHTIHEPSPNIVPLKTDAKWVHRLAGIDWSFGKVRFYADGKQKLNKVGKILFTHFGISGPMILNLSHQVSQLLSWYTDIECSVDLYPDTELDELDKRILNILDAHPKKTLLNTLSDLLPKQLAAEIINYNHLGAKHPSGEIGKDERKRLVQSLKDLRFPITGTMGFDRAVIADGGVDLDEIDFTTMESRKAPGLYIIGDLLNINRPSGGYSLQLCWTTGFVAGSNA
jgi:predicted Rossmann fold flavoprotein